MANVYDLLESLLGEKQESPTAYTLLARLKDLATYLADNAVTMTAGHEQGAVAYSTDISGGTDNTFKIAVDSDVTLYPTTPNYQTVTLTTAGMNTGTKIAAEMQSKIRALGGKYAAVTVVLTANGYLITSGTTGSNSKVRITDGSSNNVADNLKIGAINGAVDTDGTAVGYGNSLADLVNATNKSYPQGATPWNVTATSAANTAATASQAASPGRKHYCMGYLVVLRAAAAGADVSVAVLDGTTVKIQDYIGNAAPRGEKAGMAPGAPIAEGTANTAINLTVGAAGASAITELTMWGYTI